MVDRGGETTEPKPLIMKGKRRRHDPEFKDRVGKRLFASTFELEPKICKGFPLVVGVHSDVPSVRA